VQKVDVRDTDDVTEEYNQIQSDRVKLVLGYKQPKLLKSVKKSRSMEMPETSIRVSIDSKEPLSEASDEMKGGAEPGDVNDEVVASDAYQVLETMNEHADTITNEQYEMQQDLERREEETAKAIPDEIPIESIPREITKESNLPSEIQDTLREFHDTVPVNKDADYSMSALAEKTQQVAEVITVPLDNDMTMNIPSVGIGASVENSRDVLDLDTMEDDDEML
jgi:hypothetical protein